MNKDLTVGSPSKVLWQFCLPMFGSILFQQLYNIADSLVAGKLIGENALAAVGNSYEITLIFLAFSFGCNIGGSVIVSRYFGAKDYNSMRKYVGNTIWISSIFAVVLTAATCLLCTNILVWMDTPADCFQQAYDYIFVIFLGIPVTFLYNILSGIIRSVGDSKTPLYFLLISSVLNIGLDLFMIIVLDMGVMGASWATVISQLVSGVLCLIYMIKKFDILHLSREEMQFNPFYISRLCGVGIPMGLQYSITAIGSILIQTAVNGLGSTYVAAVTAATKVSQLLCCPIDAMGSTMATYGGQNVGAGKIKRVGRGLFDCSCLGVGYSIVAFLIILFLGRTISMLFVNDANAGSVEEILALSQQFLMCNGAFYILLAFVNIVRFLIQGMGFSQIAIFSGVFEMIARGVVALAMVPTLGFNAVCFANPAAWLLADCFLFPLFFWSYNKLKKKFGVKDAEKEVVKEA